MAENGADMNEQNGRDHVLIQISELNKVLAASIKIKLDKVSPSPSGKSCCIYKVHEKFRKVNEYAYTPEMVSIGPFHTAKLALQAMEDHKLRYMHVLLSRTTSLETKLAECVESIGKLEEKARKCYSEPTDHLDRDKFIEMMVVDGLFILELFGKSAGVAKYRNNDTIFNNIWGMPSVVRDLILLENQLPMIVLDCLFEVVKESLGGHSLNKLTLRFFNQLMPRDGEDALQKYYSCHGKHLLDLFSKTFHPALPQHQQETKKKVELKHIPCVTELRQAGVKFKKGSTTGSFVDIKFVDGVMEIPPILIQDQTDTLLRNLIASEQCYAGRSTYITSYAFFMDNLINSPNDVRILRRYKIITNCLGDDEDVSILFNKLCSEVTLVNYYYSVLCDEVNEYCEVTWHAWQATLKRDYFHNPWAIISFVGAILIIFLTFTATLFGMLSFVVHNS
ncbi:hypothetical protein IFM89_009565 [Coptis chinensis]|uniref:Uncharacterized protein n=1 Tax=Coptis chinensis TaxID=261450 RepID=A0A835IMB5_9MAGN|nr:hypothetical protein IFM89_009565 [Coptis chinensis]